MTPDTMRRIRYEQYLKEIETIKDCCFWNDTETLKHKEKTTWYDPKTPVIPPMTFVDYETAYETEIGKKAFIWADMDQEREYTVDYVKWL